MGHPVVRPYVLLSAAVSLDGYLDDAGPERLLLSNAADFDRVDAVRASVDAILVGAQTLRADDPLLLVDSAQRRARRVAEGRPECPAKVTVSRSGLLSAGLRVWQHGGEKLVFSTTSGAARLDVELAGLAEVVSLGDVEVDLELMLDALGARGVERLMVEGGGSLHTQFLSRGLAAELHLVVAPVIVGRSGAPRFLRDADYPPGRMELAEVRRVGDVALLRYLLGHGTASS